MWATTRRVGLRLSGSCFSRPLGVMRNDSDILMLLRSLSSVTSPKCGSTLKLRDLSSPRIMQRRREEQTSTAIRAQLPFVLELARRPPGLHHRTKDQGSWSTGSATYNKNSHSRRKWGFLSAGFVSAVVSMTGGDHHRHFSDDWRERFREILGEQRCVLSKEELLEYKNWQQPTRHVIGADEYFPAAIVYPESTEEVSQLLAICNDHQLPVIPFGSGTSLEGHTACKGQHGVVVFNMSRMNKVKRLSLDDADITVEPGIGWMDVNEYLRSSKLFFPIDPGPGASIGGMVNCRSSGTNAVRYGVMKDWILQLTVVLADGTIVKTGSRARKDSAGYDLVRLFCGSEGTLGIVTEVTLKLAPKPANEAVAWCSFPSIGDACNSVASIVLAGIQVGCAELLDESSMKIMNYSLDGTFREEPTVLFKFTGTKRQVQDAIEIASSICERNNGRKLVFSGNPESQSAGSDQTARSTMDAAAVWDARKTLYWSVVSYCEMQEQQRVAAATQNGTAASSPSSSQSAEEAKQLTSLVTDVCVPISRLAEAVEHTKMDLKNSGFPSALFGHIGDGNYHVVIMYDISDPKEQEKCKQVVHQMAQRAILAGGTCTGEHGVGMGKKELLQQMYPRATIDLMRKLKAAVDPNGIMNPGKVVNLK